MVASKFQSNLTDDRFSQGEAREAKLKEWLEKE